jgi:hypothetical protein
MGIVGWEIGKDSPLKIEFTVKKYMPIGPTTMAAVKPRSL